MDRIPGAANPRRRAAADARHRTVSGAVYANGVENSRQLAGQFEAVALAAGAEFLDAGRITPADGVDGMHLSVDAHRRLGLAIADKIRAILE